MKSIRIILLTFIWIITSQVLAGQDSLYSEYLSGADHLFSDGQYKPAIKEYQRYLFMSGSEDQKVLLKLAHCLYETGNYDLALQYFEKVYYLTDDPEIKFKCRLKEITYNITTRDYYNALIVLFDVQNNYSDLHPPILNFLFGISYFGLQKYDQAENYFLRITADNPPASQELEKIFANEKRLHRPNPTTVYILSLVLPGTGQLLTGNIKDGINSFLLVEGIGFAAVMVAIKYSFMDALLSVLPWYQRYLIGGSNNAERLAIEKRDRNRNEVYKEILEVLEPWRDEFMVSY